MNYILLFHNQITFVICAGSLVLSNFQHRGFRQLCGRAVELDIFVPSLSIAFEYQGEQHYDGNFILNNKRSSGIVSRSDIISCSEFALTPVVPDIIIATRPRKAKTV
jgi:hypothetical protein